MGRAKPAKESRERPQRKIAKTIQQQEKKKPVIPAHIPKIPGEVVSITSELESGSNAPSQYPDTARFETISNTVVGKGLADSVHDSIRIGMKSKNRITCNCGPGVKCSENPECICYKTYLKLMKGDKAQIMTDGKYKDVKVGDYWSKTHFCCSDACNCPDCDLNTMKLATENHTKRFSVKRTDILKGFAAISNKTIEEGDTVAFFVGEICGKNGIKSGSIDEKYAFKMMHEDKGIVPLVQNCISAEYKRKLELAHKSYIYINPLKKGNFTRFINHSCKPNLSILRIIYGGLSPADVRVLFVANQKINPGVELTYDYGPRYELDCVCEPCKQKRSQKKGRKRQALPELTITKKAKSSVSVSLSPKIQASSIKQRSCMQKTVQEKKKPVNNKIVDTDAKQSPEPSQRTTRLQARLEKQKKADQESTKLVNSTIQLQKGNPEAPRIMTRNQRRITEGNAKTPTMTSQPAKKEHVGAVTRSMKRLQASTA